MWECGKCGTEASKPRSPRGLVGFWLPLRFIAFHMCIVLVVIGFRCFSLLFLVLSLSLRFIALYCCPFAYHCFAFLVHPCSFHSVAFSVCLFLFANVVLGSPCRHGCVGVALSFPKHCSQYGILTLTLELQSVDPPSKSPVISQ